MISFELLLVSCMLLGNSVIIKHVNSMHTIHTIKDNSKISQILRYVWEITT